MSDVMAFVLVVGALGVGCGAFVRGVVFLIEFEGQIPWLQTVSFSTAAILDDIYAHPRDWRRDAYSLQNGACYIWIGTAGSAYVKYGREDLDCFNAAEKIALWKAAKFIQRMQFEIDVTANLARPRNP